jgi:hypothetical protein
MKTKATRQGKKKTKMNMAQKKEHDNNRNAKRHVGERDLLEAFTKYKSRLKETRL